MQILFTSLKAPFIFLFITSFQLTVTPKITIERCLPQHNYYCFGFDILDLMALLRKTLVFFTFCLGMRVLCSTEERTKK